MIRNIFTLSLLSLSLFSYNTYADIAIPEQPGLNLPINRNPEPEPQQQQPVNNDPQQQTGQEQQAQAPNSFKEGTDYILIKNEFFQKALDVLKENNYVIKVG